MLSVPCATASRSCGSHDTQFSGPGPTSVIATTAAFDAYWQFAAERLAIFYRRLRDPIGPWTADPILRRYRFTNVFRVIDRVSQYLIREVQYREDRPQDPDELVFRTLLFKFFNRIETWEVLESIHGPLSWRSVDLEALDRTLSLLHSQGRRLYSAAYIMPAPPFERHKKHSNHLALIARIMTDGLPNRLHHARDLESVYRSLLAYPGLGPFLAFQYTIDLNYSTLLNFDESEFVVAGPGALDGISKCFSSRGGLSAEALIRWVSDRQTEEFAARGLNFEGLYGRRMQLVDCQNIFCEVSKYTRASHPELVGIGGRLRIKQTYKQDSRDFEPLTFPPRWKIAAEHIALPVRQPRYEQRSLL
jgi:5-hmdU DNA kinase-like protein